MKWAFIPVFILGATTTAMAQKDCDYAGQAYSPGATICECPGLKAENMNWQHEAGRITSRRLVCGKEQSWEDTKTMCIDAQMTTGTEKTYAQYMEHFCPRLPVNFGDIQKAINQETEKFVATAPKSTIVTMIEGVCRRFKLDAACKSVLDALTPPDSSPK